VLLSNTFFFWRPLGKSPTNHRVKSLESKGKPEKSLVNHREKSWLGEKSKEDHRHRNRGGIRETLGEKRKMHEERGEGKSVLSCQMIPRTQQT
jgi:hypothetical protein